MAMNVRLIALILLLAVSLTGCAKVACTNTATIVIDGLPRRAPRDCPILIDPSLKPEVNETHGVGFFGDTRQRVVINTTGPVKLIPATPYSYFDKVATRHTATIVVNDLSRPPMNNPILIDPSLIPEANETHGVWNIWTPECDIKQRVVIRNRSSHCNSLILRLVPASPEEADRLIAVEKGVTPGSGSGNP